MSERPQRLRMGVILSVRLSEELRDEFERVARQVRVTTADAGRLAVREFVEKYKDSTERPDY